MDYFYRMGLTQKSSGLRRWFDVQWSAFGSGRFWMQKIRRWKSDVWMFTQWASRQHWLPGIADVPLKIQVTLCDCHKSIPADICTRRSDWSSDFSKGLNDHLNHLNDHSNLSPRLLGSLIRFMEWTQKSLTANLEVLSRWRARMRMKNWNSLTF